MNINKNWSKEQQTHKADDLKTKRQSRRKASRGMTRSNEGIARRAHSDVIEQRERWGFTTLKEWMTKRSRKRRYAKARKDRQRRHAARVLRDAKYAARCAKRRRDYVACRVGSCHPVRRRVAWNIVTYHV